MIFHAQKTDPQYFYDIANALVSMTSQRIFSTGISTLIPCDFKNQMALAGWNTDEGSLSSAGIWTLDKEQSMRDYLYLGTRSIMSNCAPIALGVMRGQNLPFASPGNAYKPATSNSITKAGYLAPCWSNDNCDNNACGRLEKGNTNAPLQCCPKGSHIEHDYLHFIDFCSSPQTSMTAAAPVKSVAQSPQTSVAAAAPAKSVAQSPK